ncbi:unnamed protein product [Ilex paraguariensis]|uniref:Uncharacterized protein n=1 Tax=Ilex paraguariensis TaxID=185542 RepID=A0ABC8T4B7_9AQUA
MRHFKEFISSKKLAKYGFGPTEFERLSPPPTTKGNNSITEVRGNLVDLDPMAPNLQEVMEVKKRRLQKKGRLTKPHDPNSPLNSRLKKVPRIEEKNSSRKQVRELYLGAQNLESTPASIEDL